MVKPLTLDTSLPTADSYRVPASKGRVRYFAESDALTLSVLGRVTGDLAYRDNLLTSKLNEVIAELGAVASLTDASAYVRSDGSTAFTGPVAGVTPITGAHLVTKSYVDAGLTTVANSVSALGSTVNDNILANTLPFSSAWTLHTWAAGLKTTMTLSIGTVNGKTLNPGSVSGISIIERLDIAVPSGAVPNPPAQYVYRTLTKGLPGFAVEDFWLIPSPLTVKVLIPNIVSYDPGYPDSGYDKLQTPRTRHLKAVVFGNPNA